MMKKFFTSLALTAAIAFFAVGKAAAQGPPNPCCTIVAIDAATAVATAKISADGRVFQFKPKNPATTLQAGQPVYANFAKNQVSIDGRTVCCEMLSAPQFAKSADVAKPMQQPTATAPAHSVIPGAAVATPPRATASSGGTTSPLGALARRVINPNAYSLPTISYGTPRPAPSADTKPSHLNTKVTRLAGDAPNIVRLHGVEGVDQAQDLPDGAKRLLQVHVRTLGANEAQDYIVNTTLAAQWMATHPPVPDDVKPPESDSHSGCNAISVQCASEAGKHAYDQGSKEWEKLREQAQGTWNHASDELTHDWNMVAGCFADQTLPLNDIPVKFEITPNITIPLASVANGAGLATSFGSGGTTASVNGKVGLGFPMQGDFVAQLNLFYIPCLPFVVRPKSIAANGTLGVGEKLTASVAATGKFDKTFKVPPTGGPQIPIEIIPIVIAGVPVAELDVSAYIEGNIEVGGNGVADANFELSDPHQVRFNFDCSGGGCTSGMRPVQAPATAMESAQIKGQVFVKPSVYTALQLDFDYDLLSARVGPQPYLLGMASGCAETSAKQSTDGKSTSEENHALTADLDWGIELRAEALVARQIVGKPWTHKTNGDHLWFRDLAPGGSNALIATVQTAGPAQAAKPVSYRVKMPVCYPYTNKVQYRVTWTGGATPGANNLCQWQPAKGTGTCLADPTKDLVIDLTWPSVGVYSVSVVTLGDEHHRSYSSAPQVTSVTVGAAGGGGSP